ncbi:MAG: DUF3604 domain-containing protein [Myxococcales bacterium]|nr:DUF3604 domain-containing protein [Myxococcales bacterium]
MPTRILIVLLAVVTVALLVLYAAGRGFGVDTPHAGEPQARAVAPGVVGARADAVVSAASDVGVARPKQVLFGDLHVHTTFSFDAFQMSLPMAGGDGAHPVADACDYARHCAGLDFWSINDHAVTLTPRRWEETVASIRQCNAVARDASEPDLVSYLGWEWTQVGSTPENHYGHKNVILRDLDDGAIPTRPISAGVPPGAPQVEDVAPPTVLVGAMALAMADGGGRELAEYLTETADLQNCESGVPVRDLPTDCREVAPTPKDLFGKLRDWGLATMVIPHGTTWGFYTPPGSAWDKQLAPGMHDPDRQRIIEVMSGHGNSEEFRPFREVVLHDDGSRSCPEPHDNYLPSCWRAGEIIAERCAAKGESDELCEQRAAETRQRFVDADRNSGSTVVPASTVAEWQDAGQCRDCELPSFNYRPRSSVQYILALGREGEKEDPSRFQFGFIASSDNHSARPGTGYKEVSRSEFTEARFGNFIDTPLGELPDEEPRPESQPARNDWSTAIFSIFETERNASFFMNGGLAAVHSEGRSREAIWDAMQRKEVYGTSGPRMLLWFDLLNGPEGRPLPMGSQVTLSSSPIFQVRAVGSFVQKEGCPPDANSALAPDRLARLCQGECYHPSDERRPITRIEIVRIRPQVDASENIEGLVEDPWKVLTCSGDPSGCQVAFTDESFASSGRDALYYARAIEAPSLTVAADPLGCTYDEAGRCIEVKPCGDRPTDDDCLAESEERAWSSPIYVDQAPLPEQAALGS